MKISWLTDDNQDHDSVDVVRQECCLDATKHCIKDDTDREKEASSSRWDSAQGRDHSGATSQQHGSDEDVCHKAKCDEHAVSSSSITGSDGLYERQSEVVRSD
jgi:hypothetical protein